MYCLYPPFIILNILPYNYTCLANTYLIMLLIEIIMTNNIYISCIKILKQMQC